jgi:hypothetical protein
MRADKPGKDEVLSRERAGLAGIVSPGREVNGR